MSSTLFDRFCLRLGRAAILIAAIAAPIALVETLARLTYDPPPIRRVYDPFAYRIPQPLLEEDFEGPEGDRVEIRLNELGMRGPSIAEPAAPDALTLVFLGGSTTENYALPLESTFPVVIGSSLASRLGRPVRVFNAGMSAATTSSSLARLQHQVLDLEPDLVIVMHAINDLMSGFHSGYRSDGRHLQRPALARTLPHSYFFDWLRRRPTRQFQTRLQGHRRNISEFPSLPVFERNLLSMAAIADAHGVPILFLTQAHMYSATLTHEDWRRMRIADRIVGLNGEPPDFASLALGMHAFNSATLSLSAAGGASSFDLASSLPRSRELILDDCHLTREGNRRVAEILVPVLEELLSASEISK